MTSFDPVGENNNPSQETASSLNMNQLIALEIQSINRELTGISSKNQRINDEINKINQELINILTSSHLMDLPGGAASSTILPTISERVSVEIQTINAELVELPANTLTQTLPSSEPRHLTRLDVNNALEVMDLLLKPADN